MTERTATNKIIVHCSDTDGGSAAAIRKYHIEHNHWEDIGYHFVIDQDGVIEVGRKESLVGSHCENENHDSIGICLIGETDFRPEQFKALKQIVESLLNKYGLLADNVTGHYEWPSAKAQGKTCPNINAHALRSFIKGEIEL